MFTENSVLVKTWLKLIQNKNLTKDDIPKLGNLREVVVSLLSK